MKYIPLILTCVAALTVNQVILTYEITHHPGPSLSGLATSTCASCEKTLIAPTQADFDASKAYCKSIGYPTAVYTWVPWADAPTEDVACGWTIKRPIQP